jgi:hypothetical protein
MHGEGDDGRSGAHGGAFQVDRLPTGELAVQRKAQVLLLDGELGQGPEQGCADRLQVRNLNRQRQILPVTPRSTTALSRPWRKSVQRV